MFARFCMQMNVDSISEWKPTYIRKKNTQRRFKIITLK